MKNGMSTLRGMGLALVVAAGTLAGVGEAVGQQTVQVRASSPFGGGPGNQISKRSVERYADVLGLSAEQKESALAMHEGYAASYDQAKKTQRDAMEELRRSSEDSGDHSVFMEKMPGVQKAFREKSEAAEKSLMTDLKALLTAEQEAKWGKVERMRRRETGLRGGMSGESVDLVDVVFGLKLEGETAGEVATALEDYEGAMDGHLKAKEAKAKEAPVFEPGKPLDVEQMRKAMEEGQEVSQKIVQLNGSTAEKIKGMLPEGAREKFADEVKRRAFPMVYRQSRVTRNLEAALGMSDLDAEQKQALSDLKASYDRDAVGANSRWADAIRESEKEGDTGGFAMAGGGQMALRMGEEPGALQDARKARRELDDRAQDRLKSILRPEQQERLPKAPPRGEGGGDMMEGGQIMIMSEERTSPR